MSFTVEVDFSRVHKLLDKLDRAMLHNPAGWRAMSIPYYRYISIIFRKQGHPQKWVELAESTKRQRRGKRQHIGVDTGGMRDSVTGPAAAGSVLAVSDNSLFIGSALKRTLWFHAGTSQVRMKTGSKSPHQPPRPIFVKPDAATTRQMLAAYLHAARKSLS